jgi:hypothetical protein
MEKNRSVDSNATGERSNERSPGTTGESLLDETKGIVVDVAQKAGTQASSQIDSQKGRVAGQLNEVAHALRESLRNTQDGEGVSSYVERIASQTEKVAQYLNSNSPQQMLAGVERFARRDPILFLGGSFTLGLLAARFLKSSGRSESGEASSPRESMNPRYNEWSGRPSESTSSTRPNARSTGGSPGPYAGTETTRASTARSSTAQGKPGSTPGASGRS